MALRRIYHHRCPNKDPPHGRKLVAMFYHGFRSRCIALLAAMAFACLPAGIARAESPVAITSTVTDTNSFLDSSQQAQLATRLSSLGQRGLDAYLVVVPDLSGATGVSWCEEVGQKSKLASSSLILVIATEQRVATTCGNTNEKGISDAAVVRAFSAARTELAKANPLDSATVVSAVEEYADSLANYQGSATRSTSTSGASRTTTSSTYSSSMSGVFIIFILTAIILVICIVVLRSQRKTHTTVTTTQAQNEVQQTLDLARLLLDADDVVRSSEDEIQFARAQFGPDAISSFSTALENARTLVSQGFTLQRDHEDGTHPRSPYEMQEFVERLNAAMNQLVRERDSFTQRRNQESRVDDQAREVLEMVAQTRNQVTQAEMDLQTLQLAYSAEAVASLATRPEQARALLDQAEASAQEALEAQSAGENGYQTLEIARRALTLARHQLEAIARAPEQLAHSAELLTAAIGSITSDISDVTRLNADPTAFQPLVESAQAAINAGHRAQNGQGDPLAALDSLRLAEAALDEALAPLRSAEERSARAQSGIDTLIAQADSEVARAHQHVTSHASLVGFDARSHLSFAQSALNNAHSMHAQGNDESAAGQARTAITYAQAAVNAPLNMPQSSSSTGSDLAGALGGALVWAVLNGMFSGGGNSHRSRWDDDHGWGGSGWSSGSFGGFGGGTGGSSGGFGGPSGSGHTGSF